MAPPAPSVGIYDVEATADAVYVTNLHVPFVTVVDPQDGGWADALDLREAGMEHPLFPRVESWDGRVWVMSPNEGLLAAWRDGVLDQVIETPEGWRLLGSDGDGLWLAGEDGLYRVTADGPSLATSTDVYASALSVDDGQVALVDEKLGVVSLIGQWSVVVDGLLGDVQLIDGRVWVTERRGGQVHEVDATGVIASLSAGSDTFSLERVEDDLLVLNRQGAALPEWGSYGGDPGTVLRVTQELEVVWTLELDKTLHFASSADGGQTWWTANEDALRMSRFSADGDEERRGSPLGLTIDHIAMSHMHGPALFGSHLTDEVWSVSTADTRQGPTCGWPFFGALTSQGESVYVPCQEDGRVDQIATWDLALSNRYAVADTFHRRCEDGLCTGHDVLVGGVHAFSTGFWVADPREGRLVRASDGREIDLQVQGTSAAEVQHMAVVDLDNTFVVYDPIDRRLVAATLDGVVAERSLDIATEWPLVQDGERVWARDVAYDADLQVVGQVQGEVIAVGEWIVTRDSETLRVFDPATLEQVGERDLATLEAPPFTRDGVHGPIRAGMAHDVLVVGSVFRGTLERLALPDLADVGEGIEPRGTWEDEEGLR